MCPATDFRSYPTLPNVVTVPTKGLDYGLSLEELDRRAGEFNPIENLAPLAKAGVKILHIHGDKDTLIRRAPIRRSWPAATVISEARRRSSCSRAWAPVAPTHAVMTGRNCTSRHRC